MNSLQKTFNATMRRESKAIIVDEVNTKVIFRKNNDGNNETDRLNIFYPIDAPINQGSMISFKGKDYLVLNKETSENDVYYKSSVLGMNCILADNDKKYSNIKCYCSGLTSSLVAGNTTLQVVSGNVELMTSDNAESRKVKVNDIFREFGGTYKVTNVFYQNGIAHIYGERTVDSPVVVGYSVTYTGAQSVCVDDLTYQLVFNAYEDGTKVDNATFTYTSNNDDIATVSDSGLMTLVSNGRITITATWTDHTDVTCSTTITVTESVTPPEPTIKGTSSISSNGDLCTDNLYTKYTAVFKNYDGSVVTGRTLEWSFIDCPFVNKLTLDYGEDYILIKTNDSSLEYETFKLRLSDNAGEYTSSEIEIEIQEAY